MGVFYDNTASFQANVDFKTPDMQNMITTDNGTASYSWRIDKTGSTLKAEYKIGDNTYSFISDQVTSTNNEGFEGYFDVAKNGEVIEKS